MYTLNNFYQSKAWVNLIRTIRLQRVNQYNENVCEYCNEPITMKYDCVGHHKTYLTDANVNDATIALNPDNIILVHRHCHNKIHEKLEHRTKQVYLVYGAPLSGKASYVNSIKQLGDLIINIDNIWQCISGCDRYIKPNCLKINVFNIRDTLFEQVKYRMGYWNNAFIIGGYPLCGERERLINSLGAREIFIDTKKEKCIKRLKNINDNRKFSEWEKYINDWFEKYSSSPHL